MNRRWEVRYRPDVAMWVARPVGAKDGALFKRWRNAWDYARWAVKA